MTYTPTPLPETGRDGLATSEWVEMVNAGLARMLEANRTQRFGPAGSFGYLTWHVGPLAEGQNGVLLEEVIEALIERVELLQSVSACRENAMIITHLEEIGFWIQQRLKHRREQKLFGTNAPHSSHGQGRYTDPARWGFEVPELGAPAAPEAPPQAEFLHEFEEKAEPEAEEAGADA